MSENYVLLRPFQYFKALLVYFIVHCLPFPAKEQLMKYTEQESIPSYYTLLMERLLFLREVVSYFISKTKNVEEGQKCTKTRNEKPYCKLIHVKRKTRTGKEWPKTQFYIVINPWEWFKYKGIEFQMGWKRVTGDKGSITITQRRGNHGAHMYML